MLHAAGLRAALPGSRFAESLHHRTEIDSTNRWARQLGRSGEADGTVVIADAQTAGRGRRRRAWISPPRLGIYLSVLLRPPGGTAEAGAAVQLAAGIAVAETIEGFLPVSPVLRWPNDCYVGDRKIAGVLVEAESAGRAAEFLVCGIGINVNQEADDFPEELRDDATSLRRELGHRCERHDVVVALLRALDTWEAVWRRHGMEPIRERWLELSPESVDGHVVIQTDSGTLQGTAAGLTEAGCLRVRSDQRTVEVAVGEVVRLRPA